MKIFLKLLKPFYWSSDPSLSLSRDPSTSLLRTALSCYGFPSFFPVDTMTFYDILKV